MSALFKQRGILMFKRLQPFIYASKRKLTIYEAVEGNQLELIPFNCIRNFSVIAHVSSTSL